MLYIAIESQIKLQSIYETQCQSIILMFIVKCHPMMGFAVISLQCNPPEREIKRNFLSKLFDLIYEYNMELGYGGR